MADVTQREQELRWQMSSLDDLATTNPVVRHALRDSHGYWIDAVGVDAFRVDTAFYVEPEFFEDFLFARGGRAPGMAERARRTGRAALAAIRPSVVTTTVPSGRNSPQTATALSSRPPGLLRTSSTSACMPCCSSLSSSWLKSRAVAWVNCEILT